MIAKQGPLAHNYYNQLPRLGSRNYGFAWKYPKGYFEGKLIMRTEAVDSFYIHYLTQFTDGFRHKHRHVAALDEISLFHYKEPFAQSRSPYGEFLQNDFNRSEYYYNERCRTTMFVSLDTGVRDPEILERYVKDNVNSVLGAHNSAYSYRGRPTNDTHPLEFKRVAGGGLFQERHMSELMSNIQHRYLRHTNTQGHP